MDHIDAMVQLRSGIGLRGYGQKDPIIEYRREAIDMFNDMVENINEHTCLFLFKVQIEKKKERPVPVRREPIILGPVAVNPTAQGPLTRPAAGTGAPTKEIGRNDPCPCGSGKKFKNCCGR